MPHNEDKDEKTSVSKKKSSSLLSKVSVLFSPEKLYQQSQYYYREQNALIVRRAQKEDLLQETETRINDYIKNVDPIAVALKTKIDELDHDPALLNEAKEGAVFSGDIVNILKYQIEQLASLNAQSGLSGLQEIEAEYLMNQVQINQNILREIVGSALADDIRTYVIEDPYRAPRLMSLLHTKKGYEGEIAALTNDLAVLDKTYPRKMKFEDYQAESSRRESAVLAEKQAKLRDKKLTQASNTDSDKGFKKN